MKIKPTPNPTPQQQPPATKIHPKDDGVFTIDDLICPFQRVAYSEGELRINADGEVENLPEVLRKFAGANWFMTPVANHAAKKMSAEGSDWQAFWADSYNGQDLAGSSLDHKADTQILRNGFDQARLDRALSFSSDGQRLTLADLKRFQESNLKEEPGFHGKVFGGAEFALLVKVFGRTDAASGDKYISNQDFVTLFKDNKWPQGWQPPERGSLSLWSTSMAMAEYFAIDTSGSGPAGPAGPAGGGCPKKLGSVAEGADKVGGAESSESRQVCPFLAGQPFDVGEAAHHHADMLE